MSNIEAKINSKLQEIENLFNNAPQTAKEGLQAPIIIKNNSALIQGGKSIV